jgi:hypothetical protein
MLQSTRYQQTRFWAVWDDTELVAVVVYKKGAVELLHRLAAQPRPKPPRWRLRRGRPGNWPRRPARWHGRPRPPPGRCGHAPSQPGRPPRRPPGAPPAAWPPP